MNIDDFIVETIKHEVMAMTAIEKLKQMNIDVFEENVEFYQKGIKEFQRIVGRNAQIIADLTNQNYESVRETIREAGIKIALMITTEGRN